jgi:radical SAM superfamily enzyme YgiQ (UPF0313 family)
MNVLLVNPYIHDFAAYDLWMRPHGLLKIAAALRQAGDTVSLVDCLDRKDPAIFRFYKRKQPRSDPYDCGKYPKIEIEKPSQLRKITRRYFRYGIPLELFQERLTDTARPNLIMVTSVMTYWYPGVQETIGILKLRFPGCPVILGGIYPTLCPEHAATCSGADYVVSAPDTLKGHCANGVDAGSCSPDEIATLLSVARNETIPPAYDLLERNNAAALQTSYGCPFSCTYCASKLIAPQFVQRDHEAIMTELRNDGKLGITNIAFYDDALLFKADSHFIPLMERIVAEKFHFFFHTPNGLHARFITPRVAALMKAAGFKTIRLSLETTSPERQQATGNKVTNEELRRAVYCLSEAGIPPHELEVYLLAGLPGQTIGEVKSDIDFVHRLGARASIASYSAIPGTADWKKMVQEGVIADDLDPLWHNHTIFPSINEEFTVDKVRELRKETALLNNTY